MRSSKQGFAAPDGTVHSTFTFGSEAGMDESVVPDMGVSTRHSTLPSATGPYSPGLFIDQFSP